MVLTAIRNKLILLIAIGHVISKVTIAKEIII